MHCEYLLFIFFAMKLFSTSKCQKVTICKQISLSEYNPNNITEQWSRQTVFIKETSMQSNLGEKGKPGLEGPKGEKGEIGSINQVKIQQIVNNSLLDQMNLIQDIQTKMEHEVKVLKNSCLQKEHIQTKFSVEYCSVGMKYGDSRVGNKDITASSVSSHMFHPSNGRLDFIRTISALPAWAAKTRQHDNEWLQVNLTKPKYVTGVVTQGRGDTVNEIQYVTSYKIAYGNTTTQMEQIQDNKNKSIIFTGNTDNNSYKMNRFPHPITAQYFRLIAVTYHNHISLRMDYTTC